MRYINILLGSILPLAYGNEKGFLSKAVQNKMRWDTNFKNKENSFALGSTPATVLALFNTTL